MTTTPITEVETVRGPVATAALGTTLMHEHVFVLTPDSQANWSDEWDEEAKVAEAIDKLTQLAAIGVRTIVDPTVDGLGRDIRRVARINEAVPDLNIIAATGLYTYADVPGFFAQRGPGALPDLPEPMIDLFVRDVREGIQGTEIKAAFFKCAIDHHGLTAGVERVMRAVARAHVETGAPIMVHNRPAGNTMDDVRRVLGEEGVDPRRVQLAHVGDSADVDRLEQLAGEGYLLGMDRFGLDPILSFDDRVATVAELCRRDCSTRMVLAHDAACYIDWLQPDLLPFLPNWNYLHIHDDVVPALLERGVTPDQIDEMLVDNPRAWFERR
jgi:phosphotriesterase-related protein